MRHATVVLLVLVPAAIAQERPAAKFPVGKDTTILTEPLTPEGYVDYGRVLNERLGKGVRPVDNAMALLVQAFGPAPDGKPAPAEFFRLLSVPAPHDDGDYFTDFKAFCKKKYNPGVDRQIELGNQLDTAMHEPWKADECPEVAAWLRASNRHLVLVIDASARRKFFCPFVGQPDKYGRKFNLAGPFTSFQYPLRGAFVALVARAMLQTADGQVDSPWRDLIACLRLARHCENAVGLTDMVIGAAGETMATNAILMFLSEARLTDEQLRRCETDLRSLPPRRPLADQLELCGRFEWLDGLQGIFDEASVEMTDPSDIGALLRFYSPPPRTERVMNAARLSIDWAVICRDQIAASERLGRLLANPDRPRRAEKLRKLADEIHDQSVRLYPLVKFLDDYFWWAPFGLIRTIRSKGLWLSLPFVSTYRHLAEADDRCAQLELNRQFAVALARFRLANGRYPDKLDELAPNYLPAVPGDLFSGKPMRYKPAADGYLLYSVGVNGKDDGGETYGDELGADDLRVRMPMPRKAK